jgi:hypothetical protein
MAHTSTQAETKPSMSPDQLRQEMRQIRRELGQDVEELVVQAERLMDWRYYVSRYPWAMVGIATFVGFYLVPKRTVTMPTDERTLAQLAQRLPIVIQRTEAREKKQGWLGSLTTLGAQLAMRAVMAYVSQQAGKILGQQAAEPHPEEVR